MFKSPGLATDKDILRATKQFLKTTIQKKKKGYFFKISYREIWKNSKELWKTLKSSGLNSKKAGQLNICLKEDHVIQFEPKKCEYFQNFLFWVGREFSQKAAKASSQI